MPPILIIFILGLFLGTLLNVVIIWLPREGARQEAPPGRAEGPGEAPQAGAPGGWPLTGWQHVPVVGWLVARRRGQAVHWIFPLVELATGVSLALLYARYGLATPFFYLAFVAAVLIVTGAIDWLHRSIYTVVILGGALVALAAASFISRHSLANALVGALVAGFVFVIFYMLARAMYPGAAAPFGLGDVYLAIFIGAAVGFTNLLPAIFLGMLLAGLFSVAILVLRRAGRPTQQYISYGTFLCVGALAYLLTRGL
ncbi:MAG TPA: prepilin peptidase [Roseiflexaceae bacterium]|nr:prepilin peptidase [Roseiflexaceae bacterium]